MTDSAYEVSWSGHACSFKKIHIEDGQYINADFAVLIPVDRFNRDDWSKYGAFLVGKDLAAGEYLSLIHILLREFARVDLRTVAAPCTHINSIFMVLARGTRVSAVSSEIRICGTSVRKIFDA